MAEPKKKSRPSGYRPPVFDPTAPPRTWEEVMILYNYRNPDKPPITNVGSCRSFGRVALQKLTKLLDEAGAQDW